MTRKQVTRRALGQSLKAFGLSVSTWGKGFSKTLTQLHDSMQLGEIELRLMLLELTAKLVVVLWCSKVKIDIYGYVDGELMYLLEKGRTLESGPVLNKSWRRSVSEKMRPGENYSEAALRGLVEELGLAFTPETTPAFVLYKKYKMEPHPSDSFPGAFTAGPRFRLVCELHPDLVDPDGYVEYRNGKPYAFFGWHRANEVWDMAPHIDTVRSEPLASE